MMRPIVAALITIGLLGGIFNYIEFAKRVRRPPVEINIDYAQGEYSIEIDKSFDCVSDPIFETESLKVIFKGQSIFSQTAPISKDTPVVLENLEGVEVGENEIFITCNMSKPTDGLGAMRVTIKRNDITITEAILTSVPGLTEVSGPIVFTITDHSPHEH
ncbi:MAG: hypothetical protein P8J27_14690 [Mariniblastus sp.]|nr:hypothetical protein [Mariniblastus sp.]